MPERAQDLDRARGLPPGSLPSCCWPLCCSWLCAAFVSATARLRFTLSTWGRVLSMLACWLGGSAGRVARRHRPEGEQRLPIRRNAGSVQGESCGGAGEHAGVSREEQVQRDHGSADTGQKNSVQANAGKCRRIHEASDTQGLVDRVQITRCRHAGSWHKEFVRRHYLYWRQAGTAVSPLAAAQRHQHRWRSSARSAEPLAARAPLPSLLQRRALNQHCPAQSVARPQLLLQL